jgi:hypothetical protein
MLQEILGNDLVGGTVIRGEGSRAKCNIRIKTNNMRRASVALW